MPRPLVACHQPERPRSGLHSRSAASWIPPLRLPVPWLWTSSPLVEGVATPAPKVVLATPAKAAGGAVTASFPVSPGTTVSATTGCTGANGKNGPGASPVGPTGGWSKGGGAGTGWTLVKSAGASAAPAAAHQECALAQHALVPIGHQPWSLPRVAEAAASQPAPPPRPAVAASAAMGRQRQRAAGPARPAPRAETVR